MQITQLSRSVASGSYRERLSPSLWALVASAVCAPMAALVVVPIDATFSLAVGVIVGCLIVALLLAASPSVRVADGVLHAGRARIDVIHLGDAVVFTGEEARRVRGPGLPRDAWHLFRGGIDAVVVFPVVDPDDPTPAWVIASRTPDRLAAAVAAAQLTRRTPRR
ncbi:MAG: DUF3093 domain-containing protein [Microbacterium sp.]|jgi:hypothetical protein|uniref:DUF3093 domain-containing protein n=1 Tax=Microbacterium ginsengisoli TaxID=400772 RepID=A0A0F0LWD6_9MICO|nr:MULTISPECIES: DUF3093 family protein [Microbacterium]MAL07287.1 DUF3093 domain-containing protein [Microbacterium sp.]KJL35691.1 hypothetical protein RR49_02123 [Microbacterium ginsengisoli]KQR93086.1 hypothetical protein ASG00_02360 [Microbacterium sp. Leaf351]KQS05531.1 hypothetical protein ASF93_00870 [Microbacterium sp. Leaf347]MBN9197385.1 DUF3093 domain-containing protein [Microbacterium ginsengisoli]